MNEQYEFIHLALAAFREDWSTKLMDPRTLGLGALSGSCDSSTGNGNGSPTLSGATGVSIGPPIVGLWPPQRRRSSPSQVLGLSPEADQQTSAATPVIRQTVLSLTSILPPPPVPTPTSSTLPCSQPVSPSPSSSVAESPSVLPLSSPSRLTLERMSLPLGPEEADDACERVSAHAELTNATSPSLSLPSSSLVPFTRETTTTKMLKSENQ
ncbi:unnamed protein product [Protopolystoma xenopodis]|uniref:Uncharacterized protein n=1 Tax=Protopolystoma xenopodis TaxID=117903 RepID=A0A448WEZ0_9PLAT|nr:unnamed protein product [Protopolystoma xenopodis]